MRWLVILNISEINTKGLHCMHMMGGESKCGACHGLLIYYLQFLGGNGGPHIYFPPWNKIIARNWNAALIWLKIAHAWHLVQKMMAWMVLNVGPLITTTLHDHSTGMANGTKKCFIFIMLMYNLKHAPRL